MLCQFEPPSLPNERIAPLSSFSLLFPLTDLHFVLLAPDYLLTVFIQWPSGLSYLADWSCPSLQIYMVSKILSTCKKVSVILCYANSNHPLCQKWLEAVVFFLNLQISCLVLDRSIFVSCYFVLFSWIFCRRSSELSLTCSSSLLRRD